MLARSNVCLNAFKGNEIGYVRASKLKDYVEAVLLRVIKGKARGEVRRHPLALLD